MTHTLKKVICGYEIYSVALGHELMAGVDYGGQYLWSVRRKRAFMKLCEGWGLCRRVMSGPGVEWGLGALEAGFDAAIFTSAWGIPERSRCIVGS